MSPCPICGKPVQQPKTGRPRSYCSQACRQRAYEQRQRHSRPLGWRLMPDQPSPLRMLAAKGLPDPVKVAVVNAEYARAQGRRRVPSR